MVIPGKFRPKKNYTTKLNFDKKKLIDSRKGSQVRSQNRENDHLGMSGGMFFFVEKKDYHSFFWGEVYRRLP